MADQEKMYGVAAAVAKGTGIELDVIYCLEQEKFYTYENGRWQIINNIPLLSIISASEKFHWVCEYSIYQRRSILANLQTLVYKSVEIFNKNGWLNFDLGEFDPITLEMHDHNKENYSTFRIPYPYHSSATCPLWIKTLNEIFEDDINKVNILQEFFGYCLTRDTSMEKALLLIGEGNTGKSTILHILREVIGSANCASVPLKHIGHPQYMPLLMNRLCNIDTDVSGRAEDFEAEFKVITSGESITCNQKFVETFDFKPYCKLALAANTFPRITDHTSAFYRRLIVIPCPKIFAPGEKNINLKKQLLEELSGIFNWTVQGLRRLHERGDFEEKEFMKEAVSDLRDESNPVEVFFRDCIEIDVSGNVEVAKQYLYEEYRKWCTNNGHLALANNKFGASVYRKYSKYTPKSTMNHATNKRVWKNLRYINGPQAQQQGESITWQNE